MSKSSLATETYLADSSNYTSGRKGYSVCKITPHHMAGVLTAKQCGAIFQNANRNASANYGIGNDGEIACYVEEENRAWTSSSSSNDCQAITIEVSNSEAGGDWPISDKAWNSLVDLCVDICQRYNFSLTYDGTANGSLTRHNMFSNTDCPGTYLQNRFQELADTVNEKLGVSSSTATSSKKTNEEIADEVIAGKWGNGTDRKTALTNAGYDYSAIQTIVNQKLGSSSTSSSSTSTTKSIETIAQEVIAGKWGNGDDRKAKLTAAGYDYSTVQAKVNELLGSSSTTSNKKSNEEIADEVIAGKWGNGDERKTKLTEAGYDYSAIQKIVNQKLK